MHKLLFLIQMHWYMYLAVLCINSISINLCFQINNFELVYENINIFLLNEHIWNYRNLNSHISQIDLDILFKCSGFSVLIDFFKVIED